MCPHMKECAILLSTDEMFKRQENVLIRDTSIVTQTSPISSTLCSSPSSSSLSTTMLSSRKKLIDANL
ncbi:unnamed protein product [Rotaria sp. Silwood1]|nr:unnamed protein product [Rotaria sp. Silwood1]CAF1665577.1 unnamed protein product [Rotaria sp. Silwood1]CAF3860193.1 unnamed protein product [Rotaria sp. Silwood1]CAF3959256.1 unnamed protein product [Rotaria sp. Silwood1]CAF4965730.1 unnamed protein product [Rotaria sp. Silwood1]